MVKKFGLHCLPLKKFLKEVCCLVLSNLCILVAPCCLLSLCILVVRDSGKTNWFHDDDYIQKVVDVKDTDCVKVGGNFQQCSNSSFSIAYSVNDFSDGMLHYSQLAIYYCTHDKNFSEDFSSCNFDSDYRSQKQQYSLAFNSPSFNDTGEYRLVLNLSSNVLQRSFLHISR